LNDVIFAVCLGRGERVLQLCTVVYTESSGADIAITVFITIFLQRIAIIDTVVADISHRVAVNILLPLVGGFRTVIGAVLNIVAITINKGLFIDYADIRGIKCRVFSITGSNLRGDDGKGLVAVTEIIINTGNRDSFGHTPVAIIKGQLSRRDGAFLHIGTA